MQRLLSTYRLQLRKAFDFDAATEVLTYLSALGISHVYLSPILQAAPGSSHGYDVVDHGRVSDDLGGEVAFDRFCGRLVELGMGLVLDVVPNHMSIAVESNRWWWSVLENGPASPFAHCFDVDWNAPHERQRNKVLMPILADHYGQVLNAGGIRVGRQGSDFHILVGERHLPVAPLSLPFVLGLALKDYDSPRLSFCAEVLQALPAASERDPERLAIRRRHHAEIAELLGDLFATTPSAAEAVDRAMDTINHDPELLDQLLERQNYRLAFWRAARHDLDYRRFFDINELAALRMADRRVYDKTHALILKWVKEGRVAGLRIDHPDGLQDPEGYLRWLRTDAQEAWIVVEKILEAGESLPSEWPVDGTTGYDFLHHANAVFVDTAAEEALTRIWRERSSEAPIPFDDLVRELKRQVLKRPLAPDLARLTRATHELCLRERLYRDFAYDELRHALSELIAQLPVYRTYRKRGQLCSETDHRLLEKALERVSRQLPHLPTGLAAMLLEALTGRLREDAGWRVTARFQQLSGPAMAKALEDTAFYRYHRLICLNEVGSTPSRFGLELPEFHAFCLWAAQHRPQSMLTTTTHDTKRSEDTRIRIALLSHLPDEWRVTCERWDAILTQLPGGQEVDSSFRYLLLQTLVGAWPIDYERLSSYALKAAREAKQHTTWTRTNEHYEAAVIQLCRGIVDDERLSAELTSFTLSHAWSARQASLSLQLVKLMAPGVPDIYQGTELWDHSLTDPDNRRPVDFARRVQMLGELERMSLSDILARADEGFSKLYLTWRALHVRRTDPAAFLPGSTYQPLSIDGPAARRAIAFLRSGRYAVFAPTLVIGADWLQSHLHLPPGNWLSVLVPDQRWTGQVLIANLLEQFPVALLAKQEEG